VTRNSRAQVVKTGSRVGVPEHPAKSQSVHARYGLNRRQVGVADALNQRAMGPRDFPGGWDGVSTATMKACY
jgi:hypothetical protein